MTFLMGIAFMIGDAINNKSKEQSVAILAAGLIMLLVGFGLIRLTHLMSLFS